MNCLVKILTAVLLVLLHSIPWAIAEDARAWKLDDFEDGDLKAAPGLSWFQIADDLAGGASQVRLEVLPGGPAGSKHALRLAGRLDGSRGWPFAGAWASLDGSGRSVDLGKFEGIRLRVKGPARLQVGLRAGMNNFMAEVSAGPEWKVVEVPFTTLAPLGKVPEGTRWNPAAVEVFGITTPQTHKGEERGDGKIDFQVDDIVFYGKGEQRPAPVASGPTGPVSTVPFVPLDSIPKDGWIELATDPTGDGKMPTLPDATRLEAIPSTPDGFLWIRVTLREPPHDRWLGMNLVLDVDGDPANGKAWWGANNTFKFDQVLTVWCFHVADGCQGYIGVAGADQASGSLAGGRSLRFAIDRDRRAYVLGVPRAALHLERDDFRLVTAVGSALLFNDDVPGQGAANLH